MIRYHRFYSTEFLWSSDPKLVGVQHRRIYVRSLLPATVETKGRLRVVYELPQSTLSMNSDRQNGKRSAALGPCWNLLLEKNLSKVFTEKVVKKRAWVWLRILTLIQIRKEDRIGLGLDNDRDAILASFRLISSGLDQA